MPHPSLPPFVDHTVRGAMAGALVGSGIAAVGWVIRRRNELVADLGVPAPTLVAHHRTLADTLLHFKAVSDVSGAAQALYRRLVDDCEHVVANAHAAGGAQIRALQRASNAVACATKIADEAFRMRHPLCHDARMEVDTVRGALAGVQKNMMMTTTAPSG